MLNNNLDTQERTESDERMRKYEEIDFSNRLWIYLDEFLSLDYFSLLKSEKSDTKAKKATNSNLVNKILSVFLKKNIETGPFRKKHPPLDVVLNISNKSRHQKWRIAYWIW